MTIRNILYKVLMSCLLIADMTSCSEDVVNEYSNHQCYLTYNGAVTVLQPLNAAINGSNTFCYLWMQSGGKGYYTLLGQLPGQKADTVIVSNQSTLQNHNLALGRDNSKGIIVGHSSMADGVLYVFDRVCPNCVKHTNNNRYTVNFDRQNSNNVTCDNCKRSYGLLNGGVVVAGENGDKLDRYKAFNSGTTLHIQNP